MRSTKYFCTDCYKTYQEFHDGGKGTDERGIPTPADSPLTTGKCDNEVNGKRCNGELKVV